MNPKIYSNIDITLKQHDLFNCGPIAYIVLLTIFNPKSFHARMSLFQYELICRCIVDEMEFLLHVFHNNFIALSKYETNGDELTTYKETNNYLVDISFTPTELNISDKKDKEPIQIPTYVNQVMDCMESNKFCHITRLKHSSALTKQRGMESKVRKHSEY